MNATKWCWVADSQQMEARLQMMNVSQAAEAPSGASIQFPPFFIFSRKFVSKINFFKFFKRQIIKLSFHGKCNRRPNHLKHRNSNETLELKRKLLKFRNCSKMGQLKPLINSLIFMAFLKTGKAAPFIWKNTLILVWLAIPRTISKPGGCESFPSRHEQPLPGHRWQSFYSDNQWQWLLRGYLRVRGRGFTNFP